jgi:uncharacterized 2Fe-2S/4Fe-4S cluster protein (DUF4445 family)
MGKKFTIKFQPEGQKTSISANQTLLDAAISADVFINSVCGGEGKCGKCKVQVTKGKFDTEKTELLPTSECDDNYVLACLTRPTTDLEIYIPDVTRAAVCQILEKMPKIEVANLNPGVKKYHLKLKPPTLEDNQSDFSRLTAVLAKEFGLEDVEIPLKVLRKLPKILRKKKWDATVTISNLECKNELVLIEPGDTTSAHYGVAVDIGTTTVVANLINLNDGAIIDTSSNYNKQIICGEDVLSRIMYTEDNKSGLKKLNQLIVETINYLISELPQADRKKISWVTTAGNTIMTQMFLEIDPINIKREPYIPTANILPTFKAKDLGIRINPEALVYCLPSRSGYVGGDITADILASGIYKKSELALLIDVGTNGEVVLGNKDWLAACSCSAGPAFEGGEVEYGMRAAAGAIEKVSLTKDCEVKYQTIGNIKPKGICGSGLIDLIAELFIHDCVDRNGALINEDHERIRDGDEGKEFVIAWSHETEFEKKSDIVITDVDLKNIIRTKAALYAACSLLLKDMNYTFEDLDKIYIAGGFGNYINTQKAILIGLLPDVPLEKFEFIGNGSLAGAGLALVSEDLRTIAEDIYRKMTYVELSVSNEFFNEYSSALFLPHTDIELFPTVKKLLS